ncbi:DUF134 domain-containing protein [Pseudodesulfovibrio tunisiensis]|uniref:DUF134 domain-containing protein n=1 Tax=Pseudodesulfovibrio tunisiensis TaxID=463192 RepID=UPI001FB1DA32|nr:DUF134 domain-containing protein [Pseudodesulfovibrio tunisiensis]
MPRPRKCRRVEEAPKATYFKPRGIPLMDLTDIYLAVEGLEALRLADFEGLTMEEGAERMNVSRHTFGRILAEARRVTAEALVKGQALRIEGGNYEIEGRSSAESESEEPRPARGPIKESSMTKVAVTSEGPTLQDMIDPRFGRAGGFVVVDVDTMEFEYVDNGASQTMAQGAGIQAAERVAQSGAQIVLTGYVGPKAFDALKAVGIKVGQDLDGMTVAEAVEKFKAGEVTVADAPNK